MNIEQLCFQYDALTINSPSNANLTEYVRKNFGKELLSPDIEVQLKIAASCECNHEGVVISKQFQCAQLAPEDLVLLYRILKSFEQQENAPKQTQLITCIEEHISYLYRVEAATAYSVYKFFDKANIECPLLVPYTTNLKGKIIQATYNQDISQFVPSGLLKHLAFSFICPSKFPKYINIDSIKKQAQQIKNFALTNKVIYAKFQPYLEELKSLYLILRKNKPIVFLNKEEGKQYRLGEYVQARKSLFQLKRVTLDAPKSPRVEWDYLKRVPAKEIDPQKIRKDITSDKAKLLPFFLSSDNCLRNFVELRNDKEVVQLVTAQNGLMLQFVNKDLQNDKEVVKLAVAQNGLALQHVSNDLQNDKEVVQLVAVAQNGLALEFASEELQNDKEVVKTAIAQNGLALQFTSYELENDKEVVQLAVAQNGLALEFTSEKLRKAQEVVKLAVAQNGKALQYASLELQNNKKVVQLAVAQNGKALQYASLELQNNKEVVQLAVAQNGKALQHASLELRNNKEVVKLAVAQNGLALEFASKELQNDKEVVKLAVAQSGLALQHASLELRHDKEVVKLAVAQSGLVLQHASLELRQDKEIVKIAVSRRGWSLRHASKEMQKDKDVVKLAVAQNKSMLRYASEELQEALKPVYFL